MGRAGGRAGGVVVLVGVGGGRDNRPGWDCDILLKKLVQSSRMK